MTHKIIYISQAGTYTVTFPTSSEAYSGGKAGYSCFGEIRGATFQKDGKAVDSTYGVFACSFSGRTSKINQTSTNIATGLNPIAATINFLNVNSASYDDKLHFTCYGGYKGQSSTEKRITGTITVSRNLRTFKIIATNGTDGTISDYPVVMEIYAIFP